MKKILSGLLVLVSLNAFGASPQTVDIIGTVKAVNGANGGAFFHGFGVSSTNTIDCTTVYDMSKPCDSGDATAACSKNIISKLQDSRDFSLCAENVGPDEPVCVVKAIVGKSQKRGDNTEIKKIISVKTIKLEPVDNYGFDLENYCQNVKLPKVKN